MKKNQTIQEWFQTWGKSRIARQALKELEDLGGKEEDLKITKQRILRACFNASNYDRASDPGEKYREKMRLEKKKIHDLAKAAHVLAMAAKRNDTSLSWGMEIAEATSGVRVTRKEHPVPMAHNLVAEKYFSHLETALRGRLPEIHGGAFQNHFTIGNLISLDSQIKSGRPILTETMLAFEITMYIRMHTAGRALDSIQNGQSMPEDGKPNYQLAALFCQSVFKKSNLNFASKTIGENVRELKKIGITEWPKHG